MLSSHYLRSNEKKNCRRRRGFFSRNGCISTLFFFSFFFVDSRVLFGSFFRKRFVVSLFFAFDSLCRTNSLLSLSFLLSVNLLHSLWLWLQFFFFSSLLLLSENIVYVWIFFSLGINSRGFVSFRFTFFLGCCCFFLSVSLAPGLKYRVYWDTQICMVRSRSLTSWCALFRICTNNKKIREERVACTYGSNIKYAHRYFMCAFSLVFFFFHSLWF